MLIRTIQIIEEIIRCGLIPEAWAEGFSVFVAGYGDFGCRPVLIRHKWYSFLVSSLCIGGLRCQCGVALLISREVVCVIV
jgi:hypothetical protein